MFQALLLPPFPASPSSAFLLFFFSSPLLLLLCLSFSLSFSFCFSSLFLVVLGIQPRATLGKHHTTKPLPQPSAQTFAASLPSGPLVISPWMALESSPWSCHFSYPHSMATFSSWFSSQLLSRPPVLYPNTDLSLSSSAVLCQGHHLDVQGTAKLPMPRVTVWSLPHPISGNPALWLVRPKPPELSWFFPSHLTEIHLKTPVGSISKFIWNVTPPHFFLPLTDKPHHFLPTVRHHVTCCVILMASQ